MTSQRRPRTLWILLLLAGCSSDGVYGPHTFFPGGNPHSWSDCDKFGGGSSDAQVCAGYTYPPGGIDLRPQSYVISFYLPNAQHVRLTVFNAQGALVKTLLDRDEPGLSPGQSWPTVVWGFTDGAGRRVPPGDYRIYFRAGDLVSSSDVGVP
jgi:hypothetical protein